jgi:hypothetical protein
LQPISPDIGKKREARERKKTRRIDPSGVPNGLSAL